jgi:hypothetical protein
VPKVAEAVWYWQDAPGELAHRAALVFDVRQPGDPIGALDLAMVAPTGRLLRVVYDVPFSATPMGGCWSWPAESRRS